MTGRLPLLAAAGGALVLAFLFAGPIEDTDFWWHLKSGQYIVEQHRLPTPDPFSYTAAPGAVARFNLTHEWLAQVAMYGVFLAAGWTGVVAGRAALLACLCGIVGWLAARSAGRWWMAPPAAFATASVMFAFAADRPALATFLFVAVFLAILETRRFLAVLPVLSLIWANCHSGFFLGWLILFAYTARDRGLWKVAAASIAASLANPNLAGVFATLLRYRSSPMTADLVEWQPPKLWAPPFGFAVLLLATAAALVYGRRRVRLEHWALFVAFAAASLAVFRNLPLMAVFAPVLIARYAHRHLALAVLSIAAATGAVYWRAPQPEVAQWLIPASAADFLDANQVRGTLFNTYEQGGYWIWRGQRVFIDGRDLSEAAYRDYRQILFNQGSAADAVIGPRKELLDRYGIDLVAMNALDAEGGALYPLAIALANPDDPDWQLVYDDTQELIFMRHPPATLRVFANKFGRTLHHLNVECAAYIAHSPENGRCARSLADYWIRNQAWAPARQILRLYLDRRRDADAEAVLRRLDGLSPAP